MDTSINQQSNKGIGNIFKDIILVFFNIFSYAFIGLKACTYDLFISLFNTASWHVDKAYKKTKNALGVYDDGFDDGRKKKKKPPKYSAKTLNKLEAEYQELAKELQTTGVTRTKESNIYYYVVRDQDGRIIKGTMAGFSKLDINTFLVNEGYKVYSIKTNSKINFLYRDSIFSSNKMSTKELVFWITQLSTYIKAGITLTDAVKILAKQSESKRKSKTKAFKAMSYELTIGSSFSAAMEKQGEMFPPLFINMIKAAEASGTLVETLDDMAKYYTEVDETKKQMKSAMTYPAIVSFFAISVMVFILVYIIPKFVEIYNQNDIRVSGITLFVIRTGEFLKNNIFLILGVIILIVVTLIVAYKNVRSFRRSFQMMLMHIPVIKDLIIYNELTLFTKTFASLLRNNVFITETIDILSKITNNEIYKGILYRTINNIVKGEKISEAFKDHWAIPDVAYYMIVTGESTGELAEMMQKVSEYYQGLHKNLVTSLKAFIEPILIAMLALVVGVVIISVIVPMFGMYEQVMD